MNMKKTIAAVAAGAMAVSAMATSVSAITIEDLVDGQAREYSLLHTVKDVPSALGQVDITATISDVDLGTKINGNDPKYLYLYFDIPAGYEIKSVTTSGEYQGDTTKQIQPYTRVKGNWNENYNPSLNGNYIEIPIVEGATNNGAWLDAKDDTKINVVLTLTHNKGSVSDVNADIFSGNIKVVSALATDRLVMTWGVGVNQNALTESGANYFTDMTGADLTNASATPAAVEEKISQMGTMAAVNFSARTTKEYKLPLETSLEAKTDIVTYLQNYVGYRNVAPVINDLINSYGTVTFQFNTAKSGIKWSIIDNAAMGTTKFYDYLNGDGVIQDEDWGSDFFTSYDNAYAEKVAENDRRNKKYKEEHGTNAPDSLLLSYIVPVYSAASGNVGSYQAFGQNLYTGTGNGDMEFLPGWLGFTSENTGYYGGLWNQNNLFNGALVINENITMNLSQVEAFDFNETSITFDWDAITTDATYYNQFATFLQSMKLATTSRWYWDNLVVTGADLYAAEAEDTGRYNATAGAGETAAESEITIPEADETDPAELTVPTEAETQADTTADTTAEASETEAAEQPAENPKTGNAPVALAVIPVALAAAAVVAKKRS